MDTDLGYIHTKFQPPRAIRLNMAGENVVMSRFLKKYPIVQCHIPSRSRANCTKISDANKFVVFPFLQFQYDLPTCPPATSTTLATDNSESWHPKPPKLRQPSFALVDTMTLSSMHSESALPVCHPDYPAFRHCKSTAS
jgi:hypothetical protein